MASNTQRVTAFILALVFFLSSVGATAYVIWTINKEEPLAVNNEQADNAANDASQDAQQTEGKLKGTPLSGFSPRTEQVATLETTDLTVGDGAEATASSTVTVNYTGALVSNGIIFESSLDSGQPATFPLTNLIKGWQDGIPGMKVGGKRRLVIPYAQAYGEAGSPPTIPAKSDLVFDIELISVQ